MIKGFSSSLATQAASSSVESRQVEHFSSMIQEGVRTLCPRPSSIQLFGGRAYSIFIPAMCSHRLRSRASMPAGSSAYPFPVPMLLMMESTAGSWGRVSAASSSGYSLPPAQVLNASHLNVSSCCASTVSS